MDLPLSIEIKLLDLYNKTNFDEVKLSDLARSLDYSNTNRYFLMMRDILIKEKILKRTNPNDNGLEKRYKIDYKVLFSFILENCKIFNKSIYCLKIAYPETKIIVNFKNLQK